MPSNRPGRLVCSGEAWQKAVAPFRAACEANSRPCGICLEPIDYSLRGNDRLAFTVDHLVPLWTGRNHNPLDPSGWRPAHRSCNSSRGATEGNRLRKRAKQQRPVDHYSRVW